MTSTNSRIKMISRIAQLMIWLALVNSIHSSPILPFAPRAVILDNITDLRLSYDYVIIGGGTSGLVVANRLTENSSINVLVIEYGYVDGQENGTSVPGLAVPEKYVRPFTSVPQPGLDNRTSPLYTGAVVGGGTVVNGMFFNRGSAVDYDAWEELGNPGWGWNDLLPYFKKSETFTPPSAEIQEELPGIISTDLSPHGTNGPVGSSFSNFQYPVIRRFFEGWNSIGLATQPQPNGGDANGAFYSPISMKAANQSRSSASEAYYRPIAETRVNFHLLTGHIVTKINFSGNKTATSIDFISRNATATNETTTARACREIILAAGAPLSPQVLQLSGIGSKKLLSNLGIKTIVDLPGVGQNFQDQPTLYPQYTYTDYPFPPPDWMVSSASWAAEQLDIYYKNRTGPMTIPYFGGSTVAFLPLQNVTKDYQEIITAASSIDLSALLPSDTDRTILKGYQAQSTILLNLYNSPHAAVEEVAWGGGNTVCIAMIRPFSRGSISINTTDPTKPPMYDFGTFSHSADLDVAVEALKRVREWIASEPMREIGAAETSPGLDVSSDQEIAAAIRQLTTSSWQHPTSSCSMLKRELGGVVDPELRVYGVNGLRIVDASIFPMAVAGHTSSTVYAVAEKAADIIKVAQK
ncbi:hypothetical protein Q7P37_008639 [Cladosporium fusiforme]